MTTGDEARMSTRPAANVFAWSDRGLGHEVRIHDAMVTGSIDFAAFHFTI